MISAPISNGELPHDELFMERFEAFMEKIMTDIQAFALKEARSFDQTKRDVTRWHNNQLFAMEISDRPKETWDILVNVSKVLESLSSVFNIESFVLALNPEESASQAFLGGTLQGREFWRGLRNGGDSGARAFKEFCLKEQPLDPSTDSSSIACSSKQSSRNVKEELYDSVRKALRSVSGMRNAEMKWTNHERLFPYGVYLVGWPDDIPMKNPSSLKTDQNKRLLELLNNGSLKFVKNILLPAGVYEPSVVIKEDINENPVVVVDDNNQLEGDRTEEMFSWAIQYDEETSSEPPAVAVAIAESVTERPERPRPRKKARYGERIRFHSADAIT